MWNSFGKSVLPIKLYVSLWDDSHCQEKAIFSSKNKIFYSPQVSNFNLNCKVIYVYPTGENKDMVTEF